MRETNNWLVQFELRNTALDLDAQDVLVQVQTALDKGWGGGTPVEVSDLAVWKLAEPETMEDPTQ